MLGAGLGHREHREVFPLAPAPLRRAAGSRKNACERNAAKRLRRDGRREHPHLKRLVVEDAVASNGPPSRLLQELDRRFTPGEDGGRRYRLLNGVPLNDAQFDLEVNFLECWETTPQGRARHFSWVTDREITESNGEALMRAGRARWRIENEPFNTLKHQGDGFAHHVGHGKRPRATGFAGLTRLAFLIDPIQQRCGALFGAARERAGRPKYFWERLRRLFLACFIPGWEARYRASACGYHRTALAPFDPSCP